MSQPLSIRPCEDGDIEAVTGLWRACGLLRAWNDPERDIAGCRSNPSSELFVGLCGDRIVASIMAGNDGHRGTVYYVATSPEHRGRGYGRQMMEHGENWLGRRGVTKINLMIRVENRPVGDFYRAIGYEEEPRTVMSRRLELADDRQIECIITYLEMTAGPVRPPAAAPAGHLALLYCQAPTVGFYRFLYNRVGAPWLWYERRLMDDEALAALINDPAVEIFVLYADGCPAGYFELNLRPMPAIELAYFGLMPEFIGRGMGTFLLRQAIDRAWSHEPEKLWVQTCNLDHPDALAVYQRAGFEPYDQQSTLIDDPRIAYPYLEWPEK